MAMIYLIRHGQASFGKAEYDALSDLGVRQGRAVGKELRRRGIVPDLAVCGGMQRHRQTCDAALEAMGAAPPVIIDPDWNEYDHTDIFTGLDPDFADPHALQRKVADAANPTRAFGELFDQAMKRWMAGTHDSDYREPWPAYQARCGRALETLGKTTDRDAQVLVFTSGGVISVVMQKLLGLTDETAIGLNWVTANGSFTRVVAGSRGFRLSTFNDHAHLEGHDPSLVSYR